MIEVEGLTKVYGGSKGVRAIDNVSFTVPEKSVFGFLNGGASVHLSDFPVAQAEAFDEHLEQQMARARRFVEQGLAARDAARIRVRQPLRLLAVPGEPLPEAKLP